MGRIVVAALFVLATGCRRDAEPPPAPAPVVEELAVPADPPGSDRLAAHAAPSVVVDPAGVGKYLRYRQRLLELGRAAVDNWRSERAPPPKDDPTAASVRSARAAEEFAIRMRAVEETARREVGISRDEVVAVGQVMGEVFAARQIWKMSGGDEAVERARAKLKTIPAAQFDEARRNFDQSERGFLEMKEARSARKRFGDVAVDAVLAHEDALWAVQQESMRVMSEVY